MSPHLHYEIARARQNEIVSRAINSPRSQTTRTAVNWQRSVKHRLVQMAAALAVCVAAGTAVTVSDAHSTQRPMTRHAVNVSAQQLAREIPRVRAQGAMCRPRAP